MMRTAGWIVLAVVAVFVAGCEEKDAPAQEQEEKAWENSLGMEFVWIEPGSFTMGSQLSPRQMAGKYGGVPESFDDQYPAHPVTVDSGFWISRHEVTQSQYEGIILLPRFQTGVQGV